MTLNNGDFHVKPPSADLAWKQSGFDQLAGEHVPGRKSCQLTKARQVTGPTNEDSARRSELVKRALLLQAVALLGPGVGRVNQRNPARCPQLLDLIKVLAYIHGFLR